MRRLAAWLFLLTVLTGTFGTGMAWMLAWHSVRREAKARLKATVPPTHRVIVWLTVTELADARVDDHEVRLEGKMYDILRQRPDGNRIRLELLPDHAEDALFAHLDELIAQLMGHGKSRTTAKISFGIGPCVLLTSNWHSERVMLLADLNAPPAGDTALPGWGRIDAPPPQA